MQTNNSLQYVRSSLTGQQLQIVLESGLLSVNIYLFLQHHKILFSGYCICVLGIFFYLLAYAHLCALSALHYTSLCLCTMVSLQCECASEFALGSIKSILILIFNIIICAMYCEVQGCKILQKQCYPPSDRYIGLWSLKTQSAVSVVTHSTGALTERLWLCNGRGNWLPLKTCLRVWRTQWRESLVFC